VLGGGGAGLAAGGIGSLLLASVPDSHASLAVVPVLTLLGGGCGAAGAAGVSAGLSVAESRLPALGTLGLVLGAAIGGGTVGLLAQLFGRWTLETVFAFPSIKDRPEGRPLRSGTAVAAFAVLCGLTALGLVLAGQPLVGGTLHAIAQASAGAQTTLAPLGRLLGEQDFGPLTAALIGTGEGVIFGAGLGLGLTRR
jgi:hypothetical protein